MKLLLLLIPFSGLGAVFFGYLGYKNYRQLVVATEKTTFSRILKISTQYGLAGALIFLSFIMTLGAVDNTYQWTTKSLTGAFLVSMLAGIIIFLGSIYQVYTTYKYREIIKKHLEKRD